jgi:hypothetical protein
MEVFLYLFLNNSRFHFFFQFTVIILRICKNHSATFNIIKMQGAKIIVFHLFVTLMMVLKKYPWKDFILKILIK